MKKDKIIITFNGEEYPRSQCRYISGQFYKMNKHCFFMPDNKWHRINNGLIDFDHEINKWVLKGQHDLKSGIIAIDENNKFTFGSFSINPIKNITISKKDGYKHLVISEKVLNNNFIEFLSTGIFYLKSEINLDLKSYLKKSIGTKYPFRLNYSFEHQYPLFKSYYDNYFKYKSLNKKFHKELGDITFGAEMETYNGIIPVRHCYKTGLIPLKDGSLYHNGISPFEYTTIPLQGEKGLHAIKNHCELLNKYCVKSTNGSMHIHIGGIPRTKEYALSMYKILYSLQDEIYDMFPELYRHTSEFKPNGKDYCKELIDIGFENNISKDIKKLFRYYINGNPEELKRPEITNEEVPIEEDNALNEINQDQDPIDRLFNVPNGENLFKINVKYKTVEDTNKYYMGISHPSDAGFDNKWRVHMRYFFTNLIPLLFNNRGTVEFRIHSSTFNSDKIINWLFIIAGICKFADKNKEIYSTKEFSGYNLSDIMKSVYSTTLSNYLVSYIKFRKNMMKEHSKLGDKIGEIEVKEDSLEKWNYPIKSLL